MSDDPWERLKNSAGCRHLRSKEMFYDNGIPLEERRRQRNLLVRQDISLPWAGRNDGRQGGMRPHAHLLRAVVIPRLSL